MKHSLYIGKEPNLHKIVIASALVHLVFITVMSLPIRTQEREFREYYVKLVGPIHAPPGQAPVTAKTNGTKQPAEARTKKTVPPKTLTRTPPKADMSLEPADRVAKEIERIRAISEISKRKMSREKTGEQEVQIGGKKGADEALQGAGIPGTGTGDESDPYFSLISQRIWQQWVYPDMRSTGLEVIISIKIEKTGVVSSLEIEKASGNILFDRSAMKAISQASPLPPPPGEMVIGVRFYL